MRVCMWNIVLRACTSTYAHMFKHIHDLGCSMRVYIHTYMSQYESKVQQPRYKTQTRVATRPLLALLSQTQTHTNTISDAYIGWCILSSKIAQQARSLRNYRSPSPFSPMSRLYEQRLWSYEGNCETQSESQWEKEWEREGGRTYLCLDCVFQDVSCGLTSFQELPLTSVDA